MKAITVRQPWASLIAAGVKTIETRGRRTSYRGRIAIHTGLATPPLIEIGGWWVTRQVSPRPPARGGWSLTQPIHRIDGTEQFPPPKISLPLGAVVTSAVLTDCLPMVDTGEEGAIRTLNVDPNGSLWIMEPQTDDQEAAGEQAEWREVSDQLPFGDFTPGRWALLLDDIAPTTDRCPACWGDGALAPHCGACLGARHCDPIPARGQQAVPWEWNPVALGDVGGESTT